MGVAGQGHVYMCMLWAQCCVCVCRRVFVHIVNVVGESRHKPSNIQRSLWQLYVPSHCCLSPSEPIILSASVKHKVALVDEVIIATVKLFYGSDKKTYLDGVDVTLSVKTDSVTVKEEKKSFASFTTLLWAFQLNNTLPSKLNVLANNTISWQVQELPVIAVGESERTPDGAVRKATYHANPLCVCVFLLLANTS